MMSLHDIPGTSSGVNGIILVVLVFHLLVLELLLVFFCFCM
jgi:hypothetical protein